jgi:hypothetical protein
MGNVENLDFTHPYCNSARDTIEARRKVLIAKWSAYEFDAFSNLVSKVLSVSKTEMLRREAEYQQQAALNPKRGGPKRKTVEPYFSSHEI